MQRTLPLLLLTTFSPLIAGEGDKSVTPSAVIEKIPTTVEARFSYFWPESHRFRSIYHHGGIDYQLTGTVPVYQGERFALRGLNFWWAADYFRREGESLGLDNRTTIEMEPLTAGLKWIYPKRCLRPYFGLGFKYYFIQIHNHARYVRRHLRDHGLGCIAETGCQMLLPRHFVLDLFLSYSFKQFSAPTAGAHNVRSTWLDVSGLNTGGGIGVQF